LNNILPEDSDKHFSCLLSSATGASWKILWWPSRSELLLGWPGLYLQILWSDTCWSST